MCTVFRPKHAFRCTLNAGQAENVQRTDIPYAQSVLVHIKLCFTIIISYDLCTQLQNSILSIYLPTAFMFEISFSSNRGKEHIFDRIFFVEDLDHHFCFSFSQRAVKRCPLQYSLQCLVVLVCANNCYEQIKSTSGRNVRCPDT